MRCNLDYKEEEEVGEEVEVEEEETYGKTENPPSVESYILFHGAHKLKPLSSTISDDATRPVCGYHSIPNTPSDMFVEFDPKVLILSKLLSSSRCRRFS